MSELILKTDASAPRGPSASVTAPTPTTSAENAQRFADALANSKVENPVQPSVTETGAAGSDQSDLAANNDATEDRFLALLVAQMRNQDPMNPLENAEVTTQLAQINTVRGIEEMGTTLKQVLTKLGSGNPVDSAAMVGRQVLLPADTFELTDDRQQPMVGGGYVTASTAAVNAQIFDASGNAIRRIELGPQTAGVASFEWDGKDDNGDAVDVGRYQLRLQSIGEEGAVDLAPLVGARVTGVTRGEDSINYRVQGGQSVPADEVLGIF